MVFTFPDLVSSHLSIIAFTIGACPDRSELKCINVLLSYPCQADIGCMPGFSCCPTSCEFGPKMCTPKGKDSILFHTSLIQFSFYTKRQSILVGLYELLIGMFSIFSQLYFFRGFQCLFLFS